MGKFKEFKKEIIGSLVVLILALITMLMEGIENDIKIILIISLIIIALLIGISGFIISKFRWFLEIRKIKKIVIADIERIKNSGTPIITLHNLDYVVNHRKKFKKIKDLDVLFGYFVKESKLIAKEAKKWLKQYEEWTTAHLKDIDKIKRL